MNHSKDAWEHYCETHSQPEPALLQELARETHLKTLQPRMLSGHLQGRFLSVLSKIIQPRYILEIGTFTGYATLCLAEGLHAQGVIHTIEVNPELQYLQNKYFQRSPYRQQIVPHLGEALQIIPQLPTDIDLAFIDADKKNYPAYFQALVPRMRSGGVILSDNVLWSGKVLQEIKANDKQTQAIQRYNELLATDPRVETVILPLRDGITLTRVR